MDEQRYAKVERAFQAALAARGGGEPLDLTAVCENDAGVADEVRDLLKHLDEAGGTTVAHALTDRDVFLDPAELHGGRAGGAPPDRHAMLEEWGATAIGQRVGEFTLIEQIGAGGMGVVFLAEQEKPRRTVALKLIRRTAATPALIRRFEREAQLLGRLNHPGIAQVYAAGVADILIDSGATVRAPYIAMEYVRGPNVLQFVRAWPKDRELALRLVAQVCDAIQHAHQRGVIHRDLKPGNILVATTPDDRPEVKVLDFGVAREADYAPGGDSAHDAETRLTAHGHLIGTLSYMSPEQLRYGDDVDTRCDVYALGAILYQLLVDRLPVDVERCSLAEAARRIAEAEPPALGSLDRALRGDVETIVARALQKDRTRRYESPAALARDIRHYLAGETIEARRDSVIYVLRKQVAQYRSVAVMTVLLLLAAIGFALYTRDQERRQALAEQAAQRARVDAEGARRRADQTSAELAAELSAVRIEQGRLLGQSDLAAAERLLWDELIDHPGSPYARWALRELYFRTACVATFAAHAGTCRTVSVAPDHERFATAGDDGLVRIWALADGRKLAEFEAGSSSTHAVRFSPDGKYLAVAGTSGAFLHDLASGSRRALGPPGVAAFGAQFASNGLTVAIGSDDGAIRLFDPESGAELLTVTPQAQPANSPTSPATTRRSPPPDPLRAVDFDPACGQLAGIHLSGRVRLWRFERQPGRASVTPGPPVEGHTGSAGAALRFSPDGATLATGGTDRSVKLWRVADGSFIKRFITYNGAARSVEFSPDGRRLVVPGYWRTQIFDVATGTPTALGDGGGFAGQFAAQGRRLIVCGTDGTCRIWDFAASPTTVFPSTKWLVRDLAATRVGDTCLLASIQADGEFRLRERSGAGTSPDAWRERLALNVGGRARSLAMTGDGRLIVVGREDGHLVTLRASDGAVAQALHPHDRVVNVARVSADGQVLVTGGLDKSIRIWARRADDAGWDQRLALRCAGEVLGLALSPDGATLATTSRPASLRFWSTRDGRPLQHTNADKVPWKPVFSPDGNWLALGSWDLSIQFWNVTPFAGVGGATRTTAGHAYSLFGHSQLITCQAFDDSGALLASVSNDGALRIWDVSHLTPGGPAAPVQDRRRCLATLDAGVGDAYAVTFLPTAPGGGRAVAVGYIDGTVRVWNLDSLDDYLRGHIDHQRKLRARDPTGRAETTPVEAQAP